MTAIWKPLKNTDFLMSLMLEFTHSQTPNDDPSRYDGILCAEKLQNWWDFHRNWLSFALKYSMIMMALPFFDLQVMLLWKLLLPKKKTIKMSF